jgi:hypothetical protein
MVPKTLCAVRLNGYGYAVDARVWQDLQGFAGALFGFVCGGVGTARHRLRQRQDQVITTEIIRHHLQIVRCHLKLCAIAFRKNLLRSLAGSQAFGYPVNQTLEILTLQRRVPIHKAPERLCALLR